MHFSESFYVGIASLGSGTVLGALWYLRSTLITSRCEHVSCCFGAFKLRNRVLEGSDLQNIVIHDHAPQMQAPMSQRKTVDGQL